MIITVATHFELKVGGEGIEPKSRDGSTYSDFFVAEGFLFIRLKGPTVLSIIYMYITWLQDL